MLWRYTLAAFRTNIIIPCFNVLKRKKREKEKHLYEKGFQNLLQSMMTSLQAGYSLNIPAGLH